MGRKGAASMQGQLLKAAVTPSGVVLNVPGGPAAYERAATGRHSHRHRSRPRPDPRPKTRRPNNFAGSCKLSGELYFSTPLGNELRTTKLTDRASGTCSGRLNGAAVTNVPVVNKVTGTATASCASGAAHTGDTLIFARRTRIAILTDSVFAGTQGIAHTVGAVPGHSVEHVSLLPYLD